MIVALLVSLFLLAANGFFVAAEFALIAAKRHRLAEKAASGSRAARLAVQGGKQLTVTLAGAQLGITLCTLGLGALAKPAVAQLLDPLLTAAGLPDQVAYVISFLISIVLVVFLHMVIGEMAPKSWAITHPETSALALAIPFEGYIRATRPLLWLLNGAANLALRAAGVTPKDEIGDTVQAEELSLLVRQSAEDGLLADQQHRILSGVLNLRDTTVGELALPRADVVTVDVTAAGPDIERVSLESGRSRLVVVDAGDRPLGIVHIRDVLKRPGATAAELLTEPFTLAPDTAISQAVSAMRRERAQLALVTEEGRVTGLVTLEDLLEQVLGDFEDETDARTPAPV
ncbi:membrane protein [Actinorhabdospora filicis]|uniref:Membrane protein n=1 Tax=Actinorhabdospora filicis TaxID=1785913 RepID=A0A9W6SRG1_9ACTN|nr:hemolysin family protein [Actinorhabdospora filicis]GLZ80986.1 membrane protein [Actinorhabdospora filicis]